MKPDLNEITALLAKAKIFAMSLPEDDARRVVVSPINLLCEGITTEIVFQKLPLDKVEAQESATRLAVMLEQLRTFLMQGSALELAQEIGRARKRRKEGGAKGGKAGGFKGGRPSTKPPRVELKNAYDRHLAACGSAREARSKLVKELRKTKKVSVTTARGWLRDAGITSGKKT